MKYDTIRIIYWNKMHNGHAKRERIRRRICDVKKFTIKGVNYILFKNNLSNSFYLTGQVDLIGQKNYLLTIGSFENIKKKNMNKLAAQVKQKIKEKRLSEKDIIKYVES